MEEEKPKPGDQDIDAELTDSSARLVADMEALMKRARVLILDREKRAADAPEKDGTGEEPDQQ
jgi:hypothetical protein